MVHTGSCQRVRHWNTVLNRSDTLSGNDTRGSVSQIQSNSVVEKKTEKKEYDATIRSSKETKICKVCGRTLSGVSNLNRHIKGVHERHRPHACLRCGRCFSYPSHLFQHQKSVHLKLKPFPCNICTKRFSDKSNLSKHKAHVHKRRL